MRVRLKGINSRTKRLADGSLKTYYYAWKGGPPLQGTPGSLEFIASYNAAVAQKVVPPTGVLLALLLRFQESAEFRYKISDRTRRDYVKQIKRIERAFGDFPIKALNDPEARSVFLDWRRAGTNIPAASGLRLSDAWARPLVGTQARPDQA